MIDREIYRRLVADARQNLQGGQSLEEILIDLKGAGFSQIDSIRAVVEITGASLGDTKLLVHKSRAWEMERQDNEEFHAAIESELNREQ
jgi:ribosomal protein L7/L12